jgi:hypothetical protein
MARNQLLVAAAALAAAALASGTVAVRIGRELEA